MATFVDAYLKLLPMLQRHLSVVCQVVSGNEHRTRYYYGIPTM